MDDLSCVSSPEKLSSLLQTLQSRHAADLVFTRLGSLIVSLNPHAPLTHLYSREEVLRHLHAVGQLPPHVFELGARALAAVASEGESQCLSLVGPSF